REHDGNCRGRLPSCLDERRRWGEDYVDIHADKLGHQRGQLIDVLRPLPFDDDVGPLDVTEVTQARPQPLTCGTFEGKAEKPNARGLRPRLRARRERPRRCAAEERDERAPPHVGHRAFLPPWRASRSTACSTYPTEAGRSLGQTCSIAHRVASCRIFS